MLHALRTLGQRSAKRVTSYFLHFKSLQRRRFQYGRVEMHPRHVILLPVIQHGKQLRICAPMPELHFSFLKDQ